ncbi:MAG: heme exporter protein CcmB [Methylophilaceae bacterium]|nr:heme exporter protein CcmB [Methylophilaceae bacterium]
MNTLAILRWLLWRELMLTLRRRSDLVAVLFFFVISVSLFPLGVGAEPSLLRVMGPGVLWVAALLSVMLSLGRLFAADFADGTLEQLLLMPVPLALAVSVKIMAHWLVFGLPLVLLAPLLGLQFGLSWQEAGVLTFSLLLGTPSLSLIGAIGAALTLGVRGAGVLVALLVLPLYVPVLIFGAGAAAASAADISPQGALSLLGALLVLGTAFGPYATAAALRIALD